MDIIEKKIEQLGGVEITKVFAPKKDSNFSIENFQTENKILLPEKYIFFSNIFFDFEKFAALSDNDIASINISSFIKLFLPRL